MVASREEDLLRVSSAGSAVQQNDFRQQVGGRCSGQRIAWSWICHASCLQALMWISGRGRERAAGRSAVSQARRGIMKCSPWSCGGATRLDGGQGLLVTFCRGAAPITPKVIVKHTFTSCMATGTMTSSSTIAYSGDRLTRAPDRDASLTAQTRIEQGLPPPTTRSAG